VVETVGSVGLVAFSVSVSMVTESLAVAVRPCVRLASEHNGVVDILDSSVLTGDPLLSSSAVRLI